MILKANSIVNRSDMYKQFLKYALIGGLSLTIDFAVYFLLTRYTGIFRSEYIFAKVISFFVSSIFNFNFNKKWTFEKKTSTTAKEIFKYYSVAGGAIALNALLMMGFLKVAPDLIAWLSSAVITALVNFGLSRLWVFKADPDKK